MEKHELALRQEGLSAANKPSLTVSQQTLGVELHLSTLNSKTEPDSSMVAEFSREFENVLPDHIQWAFREHRRSSSFFPTIAEIWALINQRKRELVELLAENLRREERAETERARAAGELMDMADIKAKLADIVKRIPDSPAHVKQRAWIERKSDFTVPAVVMTPKEIMARVKEEQSDAKHRE